ncbi:MAG: aldo/keto reductase [Acidimicrobiia bacterium]|nr:aldo/keto reductase [Acidimicrobiia bacterium]
MEYVRLGSDGPLVSRIGFGCEPLGGTDWGPVDVSGIRAAVREAVDAGVTLFDTADVYGLGLSEERLAEALDTRRHQVVVATKGGVRWRWAGTSRRAETRRDNSAAAIADAVEGSLRRLKLERIPLYFVHWPDGRTPVEETMAALLRCVEAGKIGWIRCSNFSSAEVTAALARAPVAAVQLPFSLFDRRAVPALEDARHRGLLTVAYGCLARGLLGGRYSRATRFDPTDRRSRLPPLSVAEERLLEHLGHRASAAGLRPAQAALQWVLGSGLVSAAVVGIKSVAQLRENLAALDERIDFSGLVEDAALPPRSAHAPR